MDYYQLLGVSKNATAKEIKQAYKQKAKKYHPDANDGGEDAQEKFKEINKAYQTLSDPDKRAAYDRMGHAGYQQAKARGYGGGQQGGGQTGFGGFDFSDVFGGGGGQKTRSGFGSIFEDLFTQAFTQIQVQVPIKLTLAALGGSKTINVHGQKITFKIPPGTRSGTTFRLKNQGPTLQNGQQADVLATVVVEIPKSLSKEQRRLVEELQETGL